MNVLDIARTRPQRTARYARTLVPRPMIEGFAQVGLGTAGGGIGGGAIWRREIFSIALVYRHTWTQNDAWHDLSLDFQFVYPMVILDHR